MENKKIIYLNVKTVPAFDSISHSLHTAYTVSLHRDQNLLLASGWTLKDAIELFARQYSICREDIRLIRPFSA